MDRECSAPYLFAQRPRLFFRSARKDCPDCHRVLKVKKTRTKTVHTLHLGCFSAHETLLQCDRCPSPALYAAEDLSRLVASGCTFGYDVVIFVGKAMFSQQRRAQEIVEQLRSRNIRISPVKWGIWQRSLSCIWPWLIGSRLHALRKSCATMAAISFIWMGLVKGAGRCS